MTETPSTDRGPTPSSRQRIIALHLAGALAGIAAVAWLLEMMAVRVVAGNSDGATAILEGRSIATGHVLLEGWMLSLDSFWTIDALANAVGIGLVGLEPQLIRAVPVAIAVGVVGVGAIAASRGFTGRARWCAIAIVIALLALPGRALALFFLQGPYHVGTALYCLVAFAALSRAQFGWRWVAAVVVLIAAILGDFQAIPLGVVPIAAAGLLDGHRERRLAAALPLLGGAAASVAGALVLRGIARAAGGFRPTRANTAASHGQMVRNLVHLPNEALALLGLVPGPFGATGIPIPLEVLHIVEVAALVGALVLAGRAMVFDLQRRPTLPTPPDRRFADLLALGVVGDLATFVLLPITSSDAYARYLTAGVIFATVLLARTIAAWVTDHAGSIHPLALVALIGVIAVASFPLALRGAPPPLPQQQLTAYLAHAHLDHGVGDYWSASIVTVASRGAVAVRPVIASGGHLVRYDKQSDAAWYDHQRFEFYVYDTALIWNGDNRAIAVATFGRPTRTVAVGTYQILVYTTPITVSVDGSQGP